MLYVAQSGGGLLANTYGSYDVYYPLDNAQSPDPTKSPSVADREYYTKENWKKEKNEAKIAGDWFSEKIIYTEVGRLNCLFFHTIENILDFSPPSDIYIITNDSLTIPEQIYYLEIKPWFD